MTARRAARWAPRLLLWAATTGGCAPLGARAQQDLRRGPLMIRSQAPIWDLRQGYLPLPPAVGGRGHFGAALLLTHVNTWADMPGYFYDGEFTRLQANLRWGLGRRTEIVANLALLGRSGGRWDAGIEGFHRALGITQARRDRFARNKLRLARRPIGAPADAPMEEVLGQAQAGIGRANPSLGLRQVLFAHGPTLLAVQLGVGLPLGDAPRHFAAAGVDLLLAMDATAPLTDRLRVHAAFGLALYPGGQPLQGLPASKVQKFLSASLALALGRHLELLLQYLNQDGAVESSAYWPLHLTTHEFALGLRALWRKDWALELAILENTVHDANTPDVGLYLGALWRPVAKQQRKARGRE